MKQLNYEGLVSALNRKLPFVMYRNGRSPAQGMFPGAIYLPPQGIQRVPWLPEILPPDMQGVVETVDADAAANFSTRYRLYDRFDQWIPSAMFEQWKAEHNPDFVVGVSPVELAIEIRTARQTGRPIEIVDLRDPAADPPPIPYGVAFHPMEILDRLEDVPNDQVYYVLCEDGEASMCFATVMKRFGFHNFYPVEGGWQALNQLPPAEDFTQEDAKPTS